MNPTPALRGLTACLSLLLASSPCTAAGSAAADSSGPVSVRKDQMWRLWDSGRFAEARAAARAVLKRAPGDPEARRVLAQADEAVNRGAVAALRATAVAAYQARRYGAAAASYEKLLELAPRDHFALRDLMWTLWKQERFEQAAGAARRLLALRPAEHDALEVVRSASGAIKRRADARATAEVEAHLAAGRHEAAVALLQRLTRENPENPDFQRRLLTALSAAGRVAEALQPALRLTELQGDRFGSWNRLGMTQTRLADHQSAMRSYRESLRLNPAQPGIKLNLARVYVNLRDFAKAEVLLRALEREPRAGPGVLPLLGRTLFWTARYQEALGYWTRAVAALPEQLDYRYYEAWTLSHLGRRAEARRRMQELNDRHGHKAAFAFLLDDALSHGETEEGIRLLETRLAALRPEDEALVFRLVELYQKSGRRESVEGLLDRYLAKAPRSQSAWLAKAVLDMDAGRLHAAERASRKAKAINPSNWETYQLLAEVARRQGLAGKAALLSARSLALNPTNPPDVFGHAQYLYGNRQIAKAKALVDGWLNRNQGAVLPILLYHGLTPRPNDPMLAYPYHHSISVYEDHLRALREAGYTSVTADQVSAWLKGEGELPPRPVFITFDDARTDSFSHGDPALRKFGFKATMMAALVNVEGRPHPPPGFASWSRMKEHQDSGYWEIQAHGDLAHIRVPTDPEGDQGLFLINRQWRTDAGRLETKAEWEERIEGDYRSNRDKIERRLGRKPSAYAFPEGAFGQKDDATNSPGAYAVNRALVGKYFETAYVQDRRGLNTRGRDPLRLVRIEPDNAWTGADLLRRFRDNNPIAEAYKLKLGWAAEEGRSREAFELLAQLKTLGVSDSILLAQEAVIRAPELEARRKSAAAEERLGWEPGYWYQSDNEGRRNWDFFQTVSFPRAGRVRFHAGHRRAEAMESGASTIVRDGVGAGAEFSLGFAHNLRVEAMQDFLSGSAPDHLSAAARLNSRWSDSLASRLQVGRALLSNARALGAGITSRYAEAGGRWRSRGEWDLSAHAKLSFYTDENTRSTSWAEARRSFGAFGLLDLKGLYRFTYDTTLERRPQYYCPRKLRMHALGPELVYAANRRVKLSVRYLPALAKEEYANTQAVQELETALDLRWGDANSLRPSFLHYQTPSYRSNVYQLQLEHHF